MTPDERDISERLQELVQSQLEGNPTADEQRELAQILRDHPWAQELYVESIQDTASLRWWSAHAPVDGQETVAADPGANPFPRRLRASVPILAALAASVLVVLATTVLPYLRQDQPISDAKKPEEAQLSGQAAPTHADTPPEPASPPASVALVTRLRGVEWPDSVDGVAEMSRLSIGQTLQLEQGEMEIYFDQAVQLVVRGPAKLQIRSAQEVYGYFGVLAARVGKAGVGFTIVTPTGRITDLGTKFGVAIDDKGDTDVAVFRGAVDLTYGSRTNMLEPSVSRRLVQGQALRLDSDGNTQRLTTIDDGRFPSVDAENQVAAARRSPIITDVRDNIRDGLDAKFYQIVPGGLREDAPAYVDREHEWNGVDKSGIPEVLHGADYVMPFNGDKLLRTLNVSVSIGRPAMLFVFLSDVAKTPAWLEETGFHKTDMLIGLDESADHSNPKYRLQAGPGLGINTRFHVYSKEITAPTTVELGSIEQGRRAWGFCMYGIAAVPLENAQPDR